MRNILFWLVMSVVVHLISWKFILEFIELIEKYAEYVLLYELKDYWLSKDESVLYLLSILAFTISFVIYQVLTGKWVFSTLRLHSRIDMNFEIYGILNRFKEPNFLYNVIISSVIMMLYILIYILSLLTPFGIGLLFASIEINTWEFLATVSCFIIICSLIMTRLLFAIPIVIIEDKSVWNGLVNSWIMTAHYRKWAKIWVTFFISISVVVMCIILVFSLIGLWVGSEANMYKYNRIFAIVFFATVATTATILTSVIYYCLKEGGDNVPSLDSNKAVGPKAG